MSVDLVAGLFRHRVLQHVLFWLFGACVIGLGLLASYQGRPVDVPELAARILLHLAAIAGAVYLNLRVLIPRFFSRKRYATYTVLLVLTVAASAVTIIALYGLVMRGILPPTAAGRAVPPPRLFVVFFIHGAVLVLGSTLMHFIKAWVTLREEVLRHEEIERQKLEAELLALRAQLNPHFLFNSLNNIYALSLDGSDKVPAFLLKLSDLMRYILYECRGRAVLLENETAFLRDYLELERIRVAGSVDVRFETLGTVGRQRVAPLLFVPLVENAFKHGVKTQLRDAYVHLTLDVREPGRLVFRIVNSKPAKPALPAGPHHGLGLPNVRKRLSLLYPDRHAFVVRDRADTFEVELTLLLETTEPPRTAAPRHAAVPSTP